MFYITSLQEIIGWNHACLQNHTSLITMIRGQYYFNWKLRSLSSLFLIVWRLKSTTDLYCLKDFDSNFVRTGGNITQTHSSLCSWAGVSEQIVNWECAFLTSSFRKISKTIAFHISGVRQLTKTGPPVTKNFPLFQLFLSAAMMAWRF